ncbi:MAG: hypothetical protein ABS948_15535 [Solibacillus sp.]
MRKRRSFYGELALILVLTTTAFAAPTPFLAETSEELIAQKKQVDERIAQLNEEITAL